MKKISLIIIICLAFAPFIMAAEYNALTEDNTVESMDNVRVGITTTIENVNIEVVELWELEAKRNAILAKISAEQVKLADIDAVIASVTAEAAKVKLKEVVVESIIE